MRVFKKGCKGSGWLIPGADELNEKVLGLAIPCAVFRCQAARLGPSGRSVQPVISFVSPGCNLNRDMDRSREPAISEREDVAGTTTSTYDIGASVFAADCSPRGPVD